MNQRDEQTGLELAEMVFGMTEQTYLDIQDNAGYEEKQPEQKPYPDLSVGDCMNDSGEVD